MELVHFPTLKCFFSECFNPLKMEPLNYRILDIDFRIPNMEPEPFQIQENPVRDRGNSAEIIRKVPFQNKESSI